MKMTGWRTLALNGGIAVGVALLTWAAGVNWTDYVSPSAAVVITAGLNFGMRLITKTPVGKSA